MFVLRTRIMYWNFDEAMKSACGTPSQTRRQRSAMRSAAPTHMRHDGRQAAAANAAT
jgi:hypothetical protein